MTTRACLPVVLAAAVAACAPGPDATARLALAIASSDCADFCAATLGAVVYPADGTVPLVAERTVACGETLAFEGLPAGRRVVVEAWAASAAGRRLVEGRSAEVTLAADDEVTVPVDLAALSPPVVLRAAPDPVDPADGGTVVAIEGESLGNGEGRFGVAVDDLPVEVVDGSWADGGVSVRVLPGDGATRLQVTNCGLSAAYPLRVMARQPGVEGFDPQGCPAGLVVRAVAPLPGTPDLVLAATCDGAGWVQRFLTAACALSAVEQTTLPGLPAAVAGDADGQAVWVVLDVPSGLVRAPLVAGGTASSGPFLESGAVPLGVAVAGDQPFVLAEVPGGVTRLFRVAPGAATRVEDVPSELSLRAIAAAGGRLLVAARTPLGEGRLATIVAASGKVELVPIPGCDAPVGVAGGDDGTWAAVACSGDVPAIEAVRLGDGRTTPVALPSGASPSSLAIDLAGTVAFAWDGPTGSLHPVDLASGLLLRPAALGTSPTGVPLVRLPAADRFLLAGPARGRLTLISPYRSGASCPGGGG